MVIGVFPISSTVPLVTSTTITIIGSVPRISGFVVEWQRDTSVGCPDVNQETMSVTGPFTSYTVTGLVSGNSYLITVRVYNFLGSDPTSTVSAMTEEAGERQKEREGGGICRGGERWREAVCVRGRGGQREGGRSLSSSTAPTGYPRSIRSGTVTPNSITVHWEEVDCLDRNGAVTGYVSRAMGEKKGLLVLVVMIERPLYLV